MGRSVVRPLSGTPASSTQCSAPSPHGITAALRGRTSSVPVMAWAVPSCGSYPVSSAQHSIPHQAPRHDCHAAERDLARRRFPLRRIAASPEPPHQCRPSEMLQGYSIPGVAYRSRIAEGKGEAALAGRDGHLDWAMGLDVEPNTHESGCDRTRMGDPIPSSAASDAAGQ